MSADDESSDDEGDEEKDVIPKELVDEAFADREERIEQATLADCEQLRAAGDLIQTAESQDEAVDNVADALEVSQERADWLVTVYLAIFTSTTTQGTTNAIQIGNSYFTSDRPLADFLESTQIGSVGEAEEYLREYVGTHVLELNEESITFEPDLPHEPPSPFDDLPQYGVASQLNDLQKINYVWEARMDEFANSLDSLLPVVQNRMSQLTTSFDSLTPVVQNQMKLLTEGLDFSNYFDSILTDVVEPLGEIGQQFDTFREIEESDFEFKWLHGVSFSAMVDLYEIYEEHGNEAAAKRLAEELRDEDDIEEFKDYFATFDEYADRQDIVDEALDAHVEGRYALSIPAILSQLDGVFIDAALDIGLWLQSDSDRVKGVDVVGKGEGSPQHIPEIHDAFRDYYRSNLWPDRNDILHGKRTDYADNELLSAKLIWLFFQTLHTVENIRSAEDIGDYYILRTIDNEGRCTPEAIADDLGYQLEYVEERCSALEDQQAITCMSDEFTITDVGKGYLDGGRQLSVY